MGAFVFMDKPIRVSIFGPAIKRRAFVYRNLNQNVWSIRAVDGPYKDKVIFHAMTLEMVRGVAKVSEAGRQRVLRDERKNVHAGIEGDLSYAIGWSRYPDEAFAHVYDESLDANDLAKQWTFQNNPEDRVIKYDPYEDDQFHYSDGEVFWASDEDGVRFYSDGIVTHVNYGVFLDRLKEKWGA
jgi:hypothetical protein